MLPTFLILGAMKTGTSSLARYLAAHPQVFMTTPKEPGYFSFRWHLGPAWYEALFDGAGDALARGEASTNYTKAPHVPDVPDRLAATVPDARLVYVVRDPVERIRSHYVHNVAHREERRPLAVAVRSDPQYLDFSRYAFQLAPFLDRFARERVLVLTTDALLTDRARTVRRVLEFIGVDPSLEIPGLDVRHNRGADKRRPGDGIERFRRVLHRTGVIRLFPEAARAKAYRVASRAPIDAVVDPATAAWILAELADDRRALPRLVGPDVGLWGDAPERAAEDQAR